MLCLDPSSELGNRVANTAVMVNTPGLEGISPPRLQRTATLGPASLCYGTESEELAKK
ncbi:hypothetical protein NONI108955_19735 [Nocardia ninae]